MTPLYIYATLPVQSNIPALMSSSHNSSEDSLESTARSRSLQPTRSGGARSRGSARSQPPRDSEVNLIEEEARLRHEALYNKAMRLYAVLASLEERARMAEPIGWRPVLDPNVSMEDHVRRLQARVNREVWHLPPPSPPPAL